MVNKEEIKQKLVELLELELSEALKVGVALESFKKEDDMKAESKYDTRSIEAGYLASAHQKRVLELKRDLGFAQKLPTHTFQKSDEIKLGALVEIQMGSTSKRVFLSMVGGGKEFLFGGHTVQVISTQSPLGKELIGLKVGDEGELEVLGKKVQFLIQGLF